MMKTIEVDSLEEGVRRAIADGAERVSYTFYQDTDTEIYSFEKSVSTSGLPDTQPVTWSLTRKGKGKWQLDRTKYIGTGGSIQIDPNQPGHAIGEAFAQQILDQIKWAKRKVFPSSEMRHTYAAEMSKEFANDWHSGINSELLRDFTQQFNN